MKELLGTVKWITKQMLGYRNEILFIVIIESILSLSSVGMAFISKNMIDKAMQKDLLLTRHAAMLFILLIVLKIGLNAIVNITSTYCMEAISNAIRLRIYRFLTHAEWLNYSQYHSSDLLTRMNSDVDTITDGFVYVFPKIISLSFGLLTAFVSLMFFEPLMAILAFVLGPAGILFSRIFGRKLKTLYLKRQELESTNLAFLQESFHNMTIVKVFNLEKMRNHLLGRLQNERLDVIMRRSRLSALTSSIMQASAWLGYFLAFGWGVLMLSEGSISFGTFTAFLQLVGLVQSPVSGLAGTLPGIVSVFGSADRLIELEKLQTEEECPAIPKQNLGLFIDQVSYAYEADKPVLDNVSVVIDPGEIVAVMGASGEGKTTLIRLLLAFLRPESGHLYFTSCDQENYEVSPSCRALISYVPQGYTLFSGTIADNLRAASQDATDNELEAAACIAGALEFIQELPKGFYTLIGEKGLGLSEGQAQRVAIVRALLREAPILILDEATSALDIESEIKVLEGIKNMKPQRTCLVITHRMTALKYCSKIIKIEDGKIRGVEKEKIFETAQRYPGIN